MLHLKIPEYNFFLYIHYFPEIDRKTSFRKFWFYLDYISQNSFTSSKVCFIFAKVHDSLYFEKFATLIEHSENDGLIMRLAAALFERKKNKLNKGFLINSK